ncbi:hypothetical protein [Haladaptatus caseinilyticus]|nr:hypothetical protein [Haladaptatus caseinilyticus]
MMVSLLQNEFSTKNLPLAVVADFYGSLKTLWWPVPLPFSTEILCE